MAYCYECGEQVAENDVFCPYCGISIQPVAVSGDESDESFDKTIAVQQPMVTPPKFSEIEKSEAASVTAVASVKSDEIPLRERLDGSDSAIKTAVKNEKETEESALTQENAKSFGGNYQAASSPQNLEVTEENWNIPTPEILDTSDPFAQTSKAEEFSADSPNEEYVESPMPDVNSSQANRGGLDVRFEFALPKDREEKDSRNEVGSFSQLPAEPSPTSYAEAEAKKELSVEKPEKSVDINDLDAKPKSSAENQNAVVPIVMPETELPLADNCPPSRFDSVSIMEKKENVEEKPEKIRLADSIKEPTKVVEVIAESKETPSSTMPISAGNDTGGKNKTKLKPLDEGTVLNGRYEIIRKIGGGGMGAVYLASDKNLGGVLRAVKEMVQSYIEDEQQEKAVNDFKRESLLLTSLDHQSIPTIYDYFFDDKEARFYLVMKYISGGDLSGRLRSAPESRIDEREVTQWAIQIADVLDYLHNRQPPIVYRDLKPANIMVDSNSGRVMLIDFGIARWVNKEEKGVTAVGTMGYAPPELFSGNVEARSDIYSLGSTMFHLLTGADPQSNPLLIFDFQKHPRPRQINQQLSDQMERILMRAVEYSADKRFASAAELRKSLEEHLDNLKAGRVTYGVKEAPSPLALSDQPVFCGFCGQKIVATDMFCAFCGAKQPLAQQGVHSHSQGYAPAPLTAQLLIIGTHDLEQPAFRLEKEDNLVGRRDPMSNIFPEVDLSKFDPQTKISRRHARIWREGSEFMVEDLGSSNGTYILPAVSDSMRLQPHQPQLLTNGDKIRLGDTTLHFILG